MFLRSLKTSCTTLLLLWGSEGQTQTQNALKLNIRIASGKGKNLKPNSKGVKPNDAAAKKTQEEDPRLLREVAAEKKRLDEVSRTQQQGN